MAKRTTTKPPAEGETIHETLVDTPSTTLTAPAPAAVPALAYDASDYGAGFEDMTAADLKVPLLFALQALNPQVLEGNPKRVPGAQPSMLMNSLTNRLYPGAEGVDIIPVKRTRTFFQYIPRTKGGGLVGRFDPTDPRVLKARKGHEFGKVPFDDETELVESVNVYALLVDRASGAIEHVIVPFQSSNIGVFQTMYTISSAQRVTDPNDGHTYVLPLYAHVWRLTTAYASNKKGNWYKFALTPANGTMEASRLTRDDPRYVAAKEFLRLIDAGRVKDDFDSAAASDVAHGADEVEEI